MKAIQQQTSTQVRVIAIILLFIAMIAGSWISIFFRLLEREIGPFATAFHRVEIATLLLGMEKFRWLPPAINTEEKHTLYMLMTFDDNQ